MEFLGYIATADYAATTVAASGTALGLLTGSLTAYSLFKPSKEMAAVNEFTKTLDGMHLERYTA